MMAVGGGGTVQAFIWHYVPNTFAVTTNHVVDQQRCVSSVAGHKDPQAGYQRKPISQWLDKSRTPQASS
jgi:hypothetical protein